MRRGRIWKRCTHCGARVKDRVCERCGAKSFTWCYVVDVAGRGEPRKQRMKAGFATKGEATEALNELLGDLQGENYVEPSKLTLAEFLRDEWLPARRTNLKPTTFRSYEMHIEQHIAPRVGSRLLWQVSGSDLNRLYAELLKSGRADGEGGLSLASVRRVHAMLSKAFTDAVRWKKLRNNPAAAADPPKLNTQGTSEMAYWTPDEARAFLASVQDDRHYALWRTYLATGMRRGEALALRRKDLDIEGGSLTVARSLVCVGYEMQFSLPKNKKRRTIDLDAETVMILKTHLRTQAEERLLLGLGKPSNDDLVFTTIEGEPIHPDRASKMFGALVRRSGLRSIRLHDLRHTHVAIAIDQGADPKTIQVRAGHHSVAFTLDRYGHLFPARQRDVAEAVGRALS
jgi:integrase